MLRTIVSASAVVLLLQGIGYLFMSLSPVWEHRTTLLSAVPIVLAISGTLLILLEISGSRRDNKRMAERYGWSEPNDAAIEIAGARNHEALSNILGEIILVSVCLVAIALSIICSESKIENTYAALAFFGGWLLAALSVLLPAPARPPSLVSRSTAQSKT